MASAIFCGGLVNVGASVQSETISAGTTSNPVLTVDNTDDAAQLNKVISAARDDKLVTKDNISDQLTGYAKASDLSAKADATTVNDISTRVDKLETTVGNDASGLVKDVAEAKTDITNIKNTIGDDTTGLIKEVNDKANQSDLDAATDRLTTAEGKITKLETKTGNLSTDGKSLTGMDAVSGTTVSGDTVKAGSLNVTGTITDGANTTTLSDIKNSMTQTESNKKDIATLKTTTGEQDTAIKDLQKKTTNISYADGAGTSIDGITVKDGNIVGNGNSAITGLTNVETSQINGKSLAGTTVATMTEVEAAVNDEKTAREAADTDLSKRIGTVTEDGEYIKKSGTNNVSENLKVLDTQAKTNADNIQTNANNIKNNKDEIARVNGELVKTNDYFNTELGKTNDYFNTELGKTNDHFNAELGKTNAALQATNKRTAGIERTDTGVAADNQTVIEGKVHFDQNGNVSGVKDLKTDTIHATGEITSEGLDAKSGEITTKGKVSAGDVSTGTLETTGNATIGGNLDVNGTLNIKDVTAETIHISKSEDNADYKSEGSIIGDGGKLSVSNEKTDKRTNITEKSELNVNEKGTVNWATSTDNTTGNVTEGRSEVTADNIKNSVKKTEGGKTFGYEENITADGKVGTVTDKEGNTSSTRQDSKGVYGYAKDKDGNKSYTKQEGNRIAESVIGQDGKETKSEMTSTDITNTAKDGTIKNDAKDIVNNATGDMTNTVGGKLTTTVTGAAEETYKSGLKTDITGDETHTVTGKQTNTVGGGQENIISGGQTNTITGGQINNITGDQTTTITGNKTETVEGKVTENYKAGQETTVTGDQDIKVSGTQTTTATDINRNASSGMIDTIDNDYGTNTETKVAGKTTTDVSIKGTGEEGKYIRGANESRDYLIKGTLKNSETKTAEATSTEITDGTNKASTRQDAKNLAGSVTNGTETGVSGIHANNDGSVSIDSSVAGGGMSSVINQKKDSIQSAVGDRTSSTVIHQDKDNVTIASSNGMVGLVGKDIVNNAQNTITNTAGTKITDTAGDSTVTTENGKGTTFTKTGSTAYREGGPTDTNISGNTITTGKVTMDYADVMKDLGVRGNANITGKTTTGSLEVTGTSTLTGDVTMESNAKVKKDLTVEGTTTTKTLKVTENAEIDGTLKVAKKATFEDSVSIAKDLSVGGDVTAKSYKVGDKTYISAAGINANDQKITNVADGSISEGSKDAVNGGQLYGVKNDLEGKVNKVGANAAAMANLHPMEFDPDSKWNIAAAIGNYGSETAAALGAFYRPNDDVMVNLSTAFGTGENMVGGGVSVRLGKGGNKLSREESNALKDQVNDLTARMDALLSVLNPNMSKDFPDVPENHWAYEAVSRLAGNDIVQGYPDGEFHGERTMTRYEMAEIIYNALSRGAEAEKELVEEFKPELQAMAASEKDTAERAEG